MATQPRTMNTRTTRVAITPDGPVALPPGSSPDADTRFTVPPGANPRRVLIDDLVPGRWQPRKTMAEESLAELVDSINEHGVLTPITAVYNERGQYEIVAGHRRWEAAKRAGLTTVPVDVRALTVRQAWEIAVIDNLQRADLSPSEEGAAFERLIQELGVSEAELARRLGKNRGYIQQRRALAGAPPEIRDAFAAGQVTFSHVRGILQGAPGRSADQVTTLTRILARLKYTTLTEAQCRAEAEETVNVSIGKEVEALGWRVARPSGLTGKPLLSSAHHRPRPTTIAELLTIVQEGRRPDPTTAEEPGPALTHDESQFLARCDRRFNTYLCAPWLRPDGSKGGWSSPAEVRASVIVDCQRLIDDLAARLAATGHRLHGENYYWQIWQGDHQLHKYLSWDSLNRTVAQLEAAHGTVPTSEPTVDAAPAPVVDIRDFQPTHIGGGQPGALLIDILAAQPLKLPPDYRCDVDALGLEMCELLETADLVARFPALAALLETLVALNRHEVRV